MNGDEMEKAVDITSSLMKASASTAPKAEGVSYLEISVLDDAEREMLSEEMYQLADELNDEEYAIYGESIEKESHAVLLVGLKEHPALGLNCRACGFKDCEEFNSASAQGIFQGPNCVYRLLDLGIAIGSALKTSSIHNARATVMIKGGLAAKNLGLSTAMVCMAIPITLDENRPYC